MEVALYLLPVTLGETPVENVLLVYNKGVAGEIAGLIEDSLHILDL